MTYRRLTRIERRVQRFRAWLDALRPSDDDMVLVVLAGSMMWLLWVFAK